MTTSTIEKPAAKAVDWARMEPLYRAGEAPLAQLARDFDVSRAAIHKHAAKVGWKRATPGDATCTPDTPSAALLAREQTLRICNLIYEAEERIQQGAMSTIALMTADAERLTYYAKALPLHVHGGDSPAWDDPESVLPFLRGAQRCLEAAQAMHQTTGHAANVTDATVATWPMAIALLDRLCEALAAEPKDQLAMLHGLGASQPTRATPLPEAVAALQDITEQAGAATSGKAMLIPDDRRRLAFDANHQISMLAEGMVRLLELESNEKTPMYYGMLARIQQLSDIVFHAARLHGDDPEDWGKNDGMGTLQRAFDGMLQ